MLQAAPNACEECIERSARLLANSKPGMSEPFEEDVRHTGLSNGLCVGGMVRGCCCKCQNHGATHSSQLSCP
jgi:hypothetical protein